MSREIKFRLFDTRDGDMNGMYSHEELVVSGSRDLMLPIYSDNAKIMQYTGLKDKNGVEIYEGDIVKVTDDFKEDTTHEIKYCIDSHYPAFDLVPDLECESNGLSYIMVGCGCETIEVIGNIYENPELKGEQK